MTPAHNAGLGETMATTNTGARIVRSRLDRVDALSEADRAEMLALMQRYYAGVEPARFERDLSEKQRLIRLLDAEGRLRGFSTIQELALEHEGQRLLVVFSGDTVLDQGCWGAKQLQRAFTRYLMQALLERRGRQVYWFLITKGYKTYLLMRHNLISYPNHAEPTPPHVQAVLDHVARLKFGDAYDATRGLLRGGGQAVKPPFQDLDTQAESDPDVRFFLRANPGHARGDELCCLALVRWRELLGAAMRYGLWLPLTRRLGLSRRARA